MTPDLFTVAPANLVKVRELSHAAVQWASRAARANLESKPDDSHSNLGWDEEHFALLSHPLDSGLRYQLGFSFKSFALLWLQDGDVAGSLPLENADEPSAQTWCDEHLAAAGLKSTGSAEMPYELNPVDYRTFAAASAHLEALGAWFSCAQVLFDSLVSSFGDRAITPPVVRCWPHHYDLGTLFVLEEGDLETARSIGLGLSPGDGSYAEPYFYCTPWPTPGELPEAPRPMHWHTEGFTSLVCEGSTLHQADNLGEMLAAAVEAAYSSLNK